MFKQLKINILYLHILSRIFELLKTNMNIIIYSFIFFIETI